MLADIFGMDGIIVVAVLAVVLFGSTQIPKLARSLGSARREFSEGLEAGEVEGTPDHSA
jgi:sec-independent protein translocase protein TatA